MKKLFYILLFATASMLGQVSTGQEQEFDYGIKNNSSQQILTPDTLVTRGADGTYGHVLSVMNQNAQTGVTSFDGLAVNADPTKYDIGAGVGYISNPQTGEVKKVTWSAQTAQTTPYLATSVATYVLKDDTGATVMQNSYPTPAQFRTHIYLGKLAHTTFTTILFAVTEPNRSYHVAGDLHDLVNTFGSLNRSGNAITPNGSNLQINVSAGETYREGANFMTNTNSPNITNEPAVNATSFRNKFRNGSGGWTAVNTTTVDPNYYDNGSGILAAVPNNKFTIKVVYRFGGTGTIHMDYGQVVYDNMTAADAGISATVASDPDTKNFASRIGWILIQQGTTSLLDATKYKFVPADKIGERAATAAGVTSLQGAYNNSVTPQITTTTTGGAVAIKRGSASDTDNVLVVQNGAGDNTFTVTGVGNIKITNGSAFVDTELYNSIGYRFRNESGNDVFKIANMGAAQGHFRIGTANTYIEGRESGPQYLKTSIPLEVPNATVSAHAVNLGQVTTSLAGKINTSEKGAANGVATLGSDGKVPNSQIPALAISETFPVTSESAMLALSSAEQGDVAVRTDISKSFILTQSPASTLSNWQELLTPTDAVQSVNGQTGNVSLTTSNISEGSNLYYTEGRVSSNTDVSANTSARHNAVTIGAANGLSLSGQQISLALASTSTVGALSSTDWNTFNNKQAALTNPITGTGTSGYLSKFTGANSLGNSLIYDNGTNVGIGTTSASAKFHILDTNGGIFFDGTNVTYNRFKSTAVSAGVGKPLLFSTQDSGTTPDLYINSTGNVGIGTTNPLHKLHVKASGANNVFGLYNVSNVKMLEVNSSSGSPTLSMYKADGTSIGVFFDATANSYLNGGNFGIGNTNPTEKLDVVGNGKFTGSLTANSIIKSGGTSSQFLKADGSVDSSTYAPLSSPTFTGTPTAPTPTAGTGIANKDYVDSAVSAIGFTSGTYTPTLSGAVNLTSTSLIKATYTKVGDIVTVYVAINGTTSAANTATQITITLPINKTTATAIENGSASIGGANNNSIAMGYVSIGQSTATLISSTTGANGSGYRFRASFQYNVTE